MLQLQQQTGSVPKLRVLGVSWVLAARPDCLCDR